MLNILPHARLGLFVFVLGHLHLLGFGLPLSNEILPQNTTYTMESNFTTESNITTESNFTTESNITTESRLPTESNSTALSTLATAPNATIATNLEAEYIAAVVSNETMSALSTTPFTYPYDLTVFTMPCGEPSSAEEVFDEDIAHNASCDSIRVSCELTRAAIQAHNSSRPGAMANCMNPTMPVLQPTTVTLQNCTSSDHARAHKAVVSLQTVSHYMKNLSEISNSYNFDTQEYTAFYDRIAKHLKGLSCSLTCHSIGMNEIDIIPFVGNQLQFIASTLPSNSTETDFTNYHCMFLTTAYETLNKLLNYYENICSIT